MILYHGSSFIIKEPNLEHSREDVDFGRGFYLTEDIEMAKKWASNKKTSQINEYELDISSLKILKLKPNDTWLDYVASNRGYVDIKYDDDKYDVIIGPTADDKLYNTLDSYFSGLLSKDIAIKVLNIADFSEQVVLKSEKELENLHFVKSIELSKEEKAHYYEMARNERKLVVELTKQLIQENKTINNKEIREFGDTNDER